MRCRLVFAVAWFAGCTQQNSPTDPIVTEAVWRADVANTTVQGEIGSASANYLDDFAADLGQSAEEEWVVLSVLHGSDTLQHVRLQQVHRGVPVLGSEIAVHADETTFLFYAGRVTRNLEGFEVEPEVTGEAAIAAFKLAHAAATGATGIEYPSESATLAIRPRGAEGADLVWRLEVLSEPQLGVEPGRWFVMVDAASGDIIDGWNGLTTTDQATGPGGNAKVIRQWPQMLDVEPMDGQYGMQTDRLETYDMKNGDNGGEVLDRLFGGNGDLVKGPLSPIGDAAINDAHGFAEETLDMMRDWYGHNSIDDNGMKIISRVHFGRDFNNAFWDGKRMTYGDGGGGIFYPLSGAIDVVAHEINHGFTEKHSNLTYSGQSGGLNESFSDVAGTLAEFHRLSSAADFDVGEDVVMWDGALRYMCDPPKDGSSIDNASQFDAGDHIGPFETRAGTDPHYSSGVPNKAFCLSTARYRVANDTNVAASARAIGGVWYLANASYWGSGSTYQDGCQGTVDAARALGLSQADVVAIGQSWADVGVDCEVGAECDGDGSCDVGDGETCFTCAADCGSCRQGCSWFDKAKCNIGIGDCSRCTEAEGCGDGNCAEGETDASCPQDCGCGAPDLSCDSVAPYGCWCDEVCADNGDCCADVDVCE